MRVRTFSRWSISFGKKRKRQAIPPRNTKRWRRTSAAMMRFVEGNVPRKKESHVDWAAWVRSFGAAGLAFIGILVAFYFTTKDKLDNHERNFTEIGKKFDSFNATLQRNYDDWAKQNKNDQEKAERVREQFIASFNQFGIASAAMKVQVDNVSKQLEAITNKLDSVQDVQRQNIRKQDR